MNWLLTAGTLLQLIGSGDTPAKQWAGQVDARTIRTSAISVALASAKIATHRHAAARKYLETDLYTLLDRIKADSGLGPLGFELPHAMMWAHLCMDGSIPGVGQVERQVYATAMHEGLAVVETTRPEHAALQALGVTIHVL